MILKVGLLRHGIRLLSLGDQVLFSAGNFLLTIMLANRYSETELAGYGIGLSISLILQGIQRNCYIVQNAILSPAIMRGRAPKVLGQQLIGAGTIILAEMLVGAVLLLAGAQPYYQTILLSTIVTSLLYLQLDFDRLMMLKLERYLAPFTLSLLFLALNAALFFAIPRYGIAFGTTMLLLAFFALLKLAWLAYAVGRADLIWGWRLLRRNLKRYFGGAVFGVIGYAGHNHLPLFILGAVAAPIHAAAFVAMRGLMQPLQVVVRSLDVVDKNFFQSSAAMTAADMRSVLRRQLAFYGAVALLAVISLTVLGESIIGLVYGERYVDFAPVLIGWGFIFAMLAVSFPLETVIVKTGQLNRYNRLRIIAGVAGTVLAFLLCAPYGAMGAVVACLGGWLVAIGCAFWIVRSSTKN